MRPSPGPHDRAPPAPSRTLPHLGALATPMLPRPPAALDFPLRNLAGARGLTLSTFSHPRSEAPDGWEGGDSSPLPLPAPRPRPLLLTRGNGGSRGRGCGFASIIS